MSNIRYVRRISAREKIVQENVKAARASLREAVACFDIGDDAGAYAAFEAAQFYCFDAKDATRMERRT